MTKISKNITYKEATRSITAIRLGIDNKPFEYELGNMKAVAENIFQPLRKWVGGAIKVTSFFRSEKLNEAIGGASKIIDGKKRQTSQHCQGRAIDIDDVYGHKTNAEMFNYIKNNLDFDNLIWEFGTDDNPDWIHVSYVSNERNRGQVLRAIKENGKTKHLNYE